MMLWSGSLNSYANMQKTACTGERLVIANSSNLTGLSVANQFRLGGRPDEIRRGLQIVSAIEHAVAAHGVGEIERQIPPRLAKADGSIACSRVENVVCMGIETRSFFCGFLPNEFFNTHACLRQLLDKTMSRIVRW
jgi:hypothetical protein